MKKSWILSAVVLGSLSFCGFGQIQEDYETVGAIDNLPVFYNNLAKRQHYPLSWTHGTYEDFKTWKRDARAKYMECLMTPPPSAPFDAVVLDEEDRGSYVAKKVVFNLNADSRVLALMLVPKSAGPHPAVLLLHDHGARFDIGKEKVIRPFGVPDEKAQSAEEWIKSCLGGRYIGDELAKRGYICLATDMLNWSDRNGGGYDAQQAIAANLMNLGSSYAGRIAFEDLSAAEFLAIQTGVDSTKIAAMGLSIGGARTWQIAALSDRITAGVSIGWMSTLTEKVVPGNNIAGGNSAYTMLHPALSQYLDYPDRASIACPKPLMLLLGSRDPLFPVESIRHAFEKMQKVWDSQGAGNRLYTRLYDVPHEFILEMQEDAFEWLDSYLKD